MALAVGGVAAAATGVTAVVVGTGAFTAAGALELTGVDAVGVGVVDLSTMSIEAGGVVATNLTGGAGLADFSTGGKVAVVIGGVVVAASLLLLAILNGVFGALCAVCIGLGAGLPRCMMQPSADVVRSGAATLSIAADVVAGGCGR